MKKHILLLTTLGILTVLSSKAQDDDKTFGIQFSGYVKNDFFYDSRQTISAREGHFLLWPAAESLDNQNNDINANPGFNFLAIQSRLTGTISGPDALGAKTSGVIEGDFFGQNNDNINLFRLRHAMIKLKWPNTELLTGQYWNPLFVTGCFPGTISFNTGTPLQSFARNPQIRVTQTLGNFQVIAAALSQRDYTSRGANGASSMYLRNAAMPDAHFQLHYHMQKEDSNAGVLVGSGIAYKTIVPRLYSEVTIIPVNQVVNEYKVDEKVKGLTAIAFSKVTLNPVTIKLQGRYGENIPDVLSISGFAVKDVKNTTTGELSYTPLTNITLWGEVHTNGKKWQVGVFGGILKNNGTKEAMSESDNAVYGLATNIESLIRVSPRVTFVANKFKIAAEIEYTSVAYGSNYDVNYEPANTTSVSNTRVLLSTIYSF
ncbi:MAG: hypothetical protein V5A47_10500 [Bacteroidales bacterium]